MRTSSVAGSALVSILFAALPALADNQYGAGYGGHHWGFGWGGMILGPIVMIVVIGAVVALIVLLIRSLGGMGPGAHHVGSAPPQGKTPVQILEERFARGEIDKDEFEDRKRTLEG